MKSAQSTIRNIFIGLSGGVDSAVAAHLLQEQGFKVHGIFMKNWEEPDSEYCPQEQDLKDAMAVANMLKIPLHVVNFSQEYWDHVFAHFLKSYQNNQTPNPDILCNREIKFKALLQYAQSLGADAIATGHYARLKQPLSEEVTLHTALDTSKDQTYFLYAIEHQALQKALFPLGDWKKIDIRALAKQLGLPNSDKKDSTGICFIGERPFKDFLQQYLPTQKGPIQNPEGVTLGEHDGLMYYTIGQRKGLHIGGQKNADEAPWYVVEKRFADNVLVIDQGESPLLYKNTLDVTNLHWLHQPIEKNCQAKIRYRQEATPCRIESMDSQKMHVKFEIPQRAITNGQSIVFYQEDQCLGGGEICG